MREQSKVECSCCCQWKVLEWSEVACLRDSWLCRYPCALGSPTFARMLDRPESNRRDIIRQRCSVCWWLRCHQQYEPPRDSCDSCGSGYCMPQKLHSTCVQRVVGEVVQAVPCQDMLCHLSELLTAFNWPSAGCSGSISAACTWGFCKVFAGEGGLASVCQVLLCLDLDCQSAITLSAVSGLCMRGRVCALVWLCCAARHGVKLKWGGIPGVLAASL